MRTVQIAGVARETGALSDAELRAVRTEVLHEWGDVRARYVGSVWISGYAASAVTPELAREAVQYQGEFGPSPKYRPFSYAWAPAGHALVLADKPAEALPLLRTSALGCNSNDVLTQTRERADLGRALEQLGDTAGACDADPHVLARWGKAKPRSVTADDVRARAKALHCPGGDAANAHGP